MHWHHSYPCCSIYSSFIVVHFSCRYEKLLNEMLNHLERQPRNKGRRVVWLRHIEPLFNGVGLVLLAHFRRIFPLFFKWMHADDDETVLLVRVNAVCCQIVTMHFLLVNVFWKLSMSILRLWMLDSILIDSFGYTILVCTLKCKLLIQNYERALKEKEIRPNIITKW